MICCLLIMAAVLPGLSWLLPRMPAACCARAGGVMRLRQEVTLGVGAAAALLAMVLLVHGVSHDGSLLPNSSNGNVLSGFDPPAALCRTLDTIVAVGRGH